MMHGTFFISNFDPVAYIYCGCKFGESTAIESACPLSLSRRHLLLGRE